MDFEEPVIEGTLMFPPQDMLGKLKKTWHKKYCLLYKASNCGIERLEVYDNKDDYVNQQPPHKIITLESCVKIKPSNQSKIFIVVTKNNTTNNTNTYYFACSNDIESIDWMTAFQKVAFKNKQTSYQMIEEDNELYYSSDTQSVFSVKLVETEASKRCKLEEKNYTLILAESDIKLKDNDVVLYEWPYRYIRKYGYSDDKFSFEAGRKCQSGEGVFNFERSNQQIFRCISSKINSMKKLLRPETTTSTPTPTMDEAQYHAALHMEPGSRSPLPPTSINSDNSLIDIDFSTYSQQSSKPLTFLSSCNFSINSNTFTRSSSSIIKPKPAKPPRKYNLIGHGDLTNEQSYAELPGSGSYRQLNNYKLPELLCSKKNTENNEDAKSPYDLVEVRCNAWRTLGVDTVVHVEKDKKQLSNDIKFTRLISDDDDSDDNTNNNNNDGDDDGEDDDDDDCVKTIVNDINDDEDINSDDKQVLINNKNNNSNNNNSNNDLMEPCETMTSSSSTSTILQERIAVEASPIINHNLTKSDSMADYDQLHHFGSIYKLHNKSGSRKRNPIVNSSTNNNQSSNGQQNLTTTNDETNHSWADYALVDELSSVRLADDSSNGYGVIRKKPNSSGTQQKSYNSNDYAIVSKPKKV
ncbi:hypothetical protein HCN44_010557 [Aphidius gifuensis]|uniref:Insulin receptor substrate 1 n=1 Tax=Aphidius gifuensis TaxID=684658 RepID=A0A834XVV3_APHGI|nr:putative uncharacterized protein DDB_G0277255 [Aphidius gifuensis]XP_044013136.1 putative uncharacterized protein DDB_G0277255 [Aphidius gifuensis]XP_044013137.1 putative uncharacterized protein DDB_G0277255 [Aphidius gifuensis]KAF7991756.1 hypothetical protein HCN44_010557 [Aphidius gifuensis]